MLIWLLMAKLERRGCWLLIPKLETRKANRVLILNKMYEVKPTRKESGWLICNGHSVTGGFFSIGSTSRGFIQQGELPSEYQVKIPQTSCLLRCYRIPHSNRFLCLAKPFPGNISWYYCYHWCSPEMIIWRRGSGWKSGSCNAVSGGCWTEFS